MKLPTSPRLVFQSICNRSQRFLWPVQGNSGTQSTRGSQNLTKTNWAELRLVTKKIYCLGQNPVAGKILTLLDLGSFLKILRIVRKSSAHTVGVFSMLPNPPECHIRQKPTKSTILLIKLIIPA